MMRTSRVSRGLWRCGLAAFVASDWPDCTAGTAVRSRFGARRRWRQNPQRDPQAADLALRRLAAKLGVSHIRVWNKHRLQPHRLELQRSELRAEDIIGLYLNACARGGVLRGREDGAALANEGRRDEPKIEYYRTRWRCSRRSIRRPAKIGKTAARHTSEQFVAFLTDIVAHQPTGQEIHVIADNLSAHKTKRVEAFLSEHPAVQLHFTPTYSSWLNQVELWFAKISRESRAECSAQWQI